MCEAIRCLEVGFLLLSACSLEGGTESLAAGLQDKGTVAWRAWGQARGWAEPSGQPGVHLAPGEVAGLWGEAGEGTTS